jgi:hypothetical protein
MPMKKTAGGAAPKPTIQVIERMFALIDVLASREDSHRAAPLYNPPHPQ